MTTDRIYLRSDLGYDPKLQNNNLVAFSPDIMPLYITKISNVDDLISSYPSFIAQTVVPEEQNLIYVRGAATDPTKAVSATVSIFQVTNELILWPQVLKESTSIGNIKLEFDPKNPAEEVKGVTASLDALKLIPEGRGGRHGTLLAGVDTPSFESIPDAKNYKELLKSVGSPNSLAFYNAVVADSVFDVYTMTTRLRLFDDGTTPVSLELDIEALGMPTGYDVAFYSDNPDIKLDRTAIVNSGRIGITITAKNGMDSLITIQIYKNDSTQYPDDYASVSLLAYVVESPGESGGIQTIALLGAEHILFNSSIRISRALENSGQTAEGFFFRDQLGDTDILPRTGSASQSPDIQPLGTSPVSNVTDVLSEYNTDASDDKGVNIVAQSPNYVYLRGTTNSAIDIETSLYLVPNALLISPDMYGQSAVMEPDQAGNLVTAIRRFTTTTSGTAIITSPFNVLNPPPVPADSNHYCLIAEARPYTQDEPPWPHQVGIPTGSDFTLWVLNTPTVAWRNVTWETNPDAPSETWQTNMTIPAQFSPSTNWSLLLSSKTLPVGGYFGFSATGSIPLNYDKTKITGPGQNISVSFTGVQGPYSATITVEWWQGDGPQRPSDSQLTPVLQQVVGGSTFLGQDSRVGYRRTASEKQSPFVVGPDYPNLANKEVPRGDHVKGGRLLGKAHPIPELHPGRFEGGPIVYVPIETAINLGGDTQGVYID